MKLHIAKSHQEKGYFITAQKDEKNGSVQTYRGIFAIYDGGPGDGIPKARRALRQEGMQKPGPRTSMQTLCRLKEKGRTATIASVKGRTNFAGFVEKHYRDYLKNDRQLKGVKQEIQKLDVLVY